MFRKIHSNRNPQDTLLSELRKEFAVYIDRINASITGFLKQHPNLVYTLMVLFLAASMLLSFTILHNEGQKPGVSAKVMASPVSEGFGRILTTGAALKESIQLKAQIETLIAKDSLSKADSAFLGKAIDRLHQLSIPHEKSNQPH
jgi:hypothetical protein